MDRPVRAGLGADTTTRTLLGVDQEHDLSFSVIYAEVTYLPDGMLQPTGLQAAVDGVELERFVPKSEKAFWTFRPPHLGHLTSGAEEKERTSFSNFSPHS